MRGKKSLRAQREAATQKKIVVLFCSIIAMFIVSSILLSSTNAQAAPAEITYKYYTSVQVESGDTLWEIASEYITDEYTDMNEYMSEVCSINHISENEIHAGQYIVVPYYSAEVVE